MAEIDLFRQVAWVLGVCSLTLSFVVKQRILSSGQIISGDREQKLKQQVAKLTTCTIITFALCDGAVLFGFIVAFLSKNIQDMYFPLGLGVVGFGAHFPRQDEWKKYIEQN